ncbi:hypothetical protein [Bifidobacterium adolescentis]|uniref:hypothetical protein n=1 Tax=Bifidobacterium adolescentis TaxID=1680 RepID=UPI0022E34769|nr:hypothetical protein [Bifidobacterium adolescentis]
MSSGAPAFIQWLSLAGASFSRKEFVMKLYAVIGTITPGCGVYIHLYGLHTDRKAAERRRAEVEAAARRANEGEIEDVAPRLVKVVEADKDAAVDIFLGGYVE